MDLDAVEIPKSWKELDLDQLKDVVMIIGDSNTGKTTFTHFLFTEMKKNGRKVAYLDGDPGQSSIGPPTTMAISTEIMSNYSVDDRKIWRIFVGSISPKGHMLQMVVGAKRLVDVAKSNGAKVFLYDTTGLVDPMQGGLALKIAKIDLLRPKTLITFQRDDELAQLLNPLRRLKHINLVVLDPSDRIKDRDKGTRQEHRRMKYQEYFVKKPEIKLNWKRIAVFPAPRFAINRLIALENREGFTDGLGIITAIDRDKKYIRVILPNISPENINSIRLGDVLVNPETFEDRFI